MSEEDNVLLAVEKGVASVTMNRPAVHNAFDEAMIARLSALWDELAGRDDVSAIVLRGRGKSFSAGADLGWMRRAAGYDDARNREDAMALSHMLHGLYTMPKVTIACVFGAAMGGGMGLVSCCDIVIADREARFALSETRLGLIPAVIGPYVVRAMGPRHARRFFQTAERFDGEKAHRIGFVHELADRPEDVEYILHKILLEIGRNGPQAMVAAKRLCLDLADNGPDEAQRAATARLIAAIRSAPEAREGITAFLEKRPPAWTRE